MDKTIDKVATCPKCGFSEPYEADEFGMDYYQAIGLCPMCDTPTIDENGHPTRVFISYTAIDKPKPK